MLQQEHNIFIVHLAVCVQVRIGSYRETAGVQQMLQQVSGVLGIHLGVDRKLTQHLIVAYQRSGSQGRITAFHGDGIPLRLGAGVVHRSQAAAAGERILSDLGNAGRNDHTCELIAIGKGTGRDFRDRHTVDRRGDQSDTGLIYIAGDHSIAILQLKLHTLFHVHRKGCLGFVVRNGKGLLTCRRSVKAGDSETGLHHFLRAVGVFHMQPQSHSIQLTAGGISCLKRKT